jgi:hypothetical protein
METPHLDRFFATSCNDRPKMEMLTTLAAGVLAGRILSADKSATGWWAKVGKEAAIIAVECAEKLASRISK